MEIELEKIEAYFNEGRRIWEIQPELVVSRKFFENWEGTHRPRPFVIHDSGIRMAEQELVLADDTHSVGRVLWDFPEECATLAVEGHASRQTFLLTFADGEAQIIEGALELFKDNELSYGERLEVVHDVLAYLRLHQPTTDLLNLTKSSFLAALDGVSEHYPGSTIRLMHRLRLDSIRRMVGKATEDMAIDELSNQLTLPLDGSYAVSSAQTPSEELEDFTRPGPSTLRLTQQTRWAILTDLEFIAAATHAVADMEEAFVLDLTAAEIIEQTSPTEFTVKIPVPTTVPVLEGDRLQVHIRGDDGAAATLRIDLYDRSVMYGRLRWPDAVAASPGTTGMFARRRGSPNRFLAGLFNAFVVDFAANRNSSGEAVDAMLAVVPTTFENLTIPAEPSELDPDQRQAWINACHERNRVVAIQGPPGTGKTFVIEYVIREMSARNHRVLLTAPSNTAIDNICRRIVDLPLLRVGRDAERIAEDIAAACWINNPDAVQAFARKRKESSAVIYAGTHVAILRDNVLAADLEKNGLFDVIIFDEAGMARMDEFLVCARRAKRVVLFGDHQQLPPFPLPNEVIETLKEYGPATNPQWATLKQSALEWLIVQRQFPVTILRLSHRCQNPRLMRFSSTLFYNAQVRACDQADYYRLDYEARRRKYPPSTLRFYRTSSLRPDLRRERLIIEGARPGLENRLEAQLCLYALSELMKRFPLREISIIVPYRRQVKLIQSSLKSEASGLRAGRVDISEDEWRWFLGNRVATVDSFQGGESDAVITCYVRSGPETGIGFVDDPNRINVAHTRTRREMVIIGDLEHLKSNARSRVFHRMERAIERDGEIIDVTEEMLAGCPAL